MHKGLVDQINKELASVKGKLEKQKVAEEQAKLKKIQQEMEEERRKKEAEEAAARKAEEEKDKATLESMQRDLENANAKLAEQHEQERRDHELALRLAEESGDVVEELATPGLKRSSKSL